MSASRCIASALSLFTLILATSRATWAEDLYVDNRVGDDIYDGRVERPLDARSGPTRTISRALRYVRPGDTLHIANDGVPYFESLEIVGWRFGGHFTIEGNGAVVSGAKIVPFTAWKYLGNEYWRFTPRRKTFYQIISGDKALPEHACAPNAAKRPEIPAGTWCAWRGSIYYHVLPGGAQTKDDVPLAFAVEEVGITLLDASHVTIHNLELRHFRLDGVNVHDRCRNVILDNVRLIENGRAGLAVGGSSQVGLKDSTVEGNRVAQILNSEVAQTELLNCKIGPAVFEPDGASIRITGGHVLVDEAEVFDLPR